MSNMSSKKAQTLRELKIHNHKLRQTWL